MKLCENNVTDTGTRRTWLVELRGDKNFLGELFANFSWQELGKEKEPRFFLEAVYGQIFLHSQTFERFTVPKHVQCEGERLLSLMNGILKLQVPGRPNDFTEVGGVFVEENQTRMRNPLLCTYPEHMPPHSSSPFESSELVELSAVDENAENLLQLFGSHHCFWSTLPNMMEIITSDMPAWKYEKGLPSEEKIKHFQYTIQQLGVGENNSSEINPNQECVPRTPMPLIEARGVIHSLLAGWINWKLNQMPQEMSLSLGE